MLEAIEDYIAEHSDPEPELLKQINREAQSKLLPGNMACGHLQGRLLKMFVRMICPTNVLEIGTYTGYSALCMAEGLTGHATLHTIEINDELEDYIRANFKRSPYSSKIALHIGDALEVIPRFEDELFDLVFIDGNKRGYLELFELTLPKTRKGGIIIVDNTLWYGKVLEKPKNNDWQTKGILEFNDKLRDDKRVEKVILPIRDGLTLIRKK